MPSYTIKMRVEKFPDVTLARHDILVKGRERRKLVLAWREGKARDRT